jgi:hypothetical protein
MKNIKQNNNMRKEIGVGFTEIIIHNVMNLVILFVRLTASFFFVVLTIFIKNLSKLDLSYLKIFISLLLQSKKIFLPLLFLIIILYNFFFIASCIVKGFFFCSNFYKLFFFSY